MKKDCTVRPNCNLTERAACIVTTEVILDVFNANDAPWETGTDDWYLIDTESYTEQAIDLCNELAAPRIVNLKYRYNIMPNSTVRISLHFGELEHGRSISSIAYHSNNTYSKIEVNPLSVAAQQSLERIRKDSWEIKDIVDSRLDKVRGDMSMITTNWACIEAADGEFYNIMSAKEHADKAEIYLKHRVITMPQNVQNFIYEWLDTNKKRIEELLNKAKSEHAARESWIEKTNALLEMEPREFESWAADLFSALGYEVDLTPYSSDKGVDVICRKDDTLAAVQCKRYQGVVGAPDIQRFIGAMQNMKADIGYFLTTGTFSVFAEKAAKGQNIILCDKMGLKKLVDAATSDD